MIKRKGTNKITKVIRTLALGLAITASGFILETPAHAEINLGSGKYWYYDQGKYTDEQHAYTYKGASGDLITTDNLNIARYAAIGDIQTKDGMLQNTQEDRNKAIEQEKINKQLEMLKPENQPVSEEEFEKIASEEMLKLVNEHRAEKGISPLRGSKELDESAFIKSKHMVENGYYSHNWHGINFKDLSVQIGGAKIYRENIDLTTCATFDGTPHSARALAHNVFNDWKNSPGHDDAMLGACYTETGFGFAKGSWKTWDACYATQQFR